MWLFGGSIDYGPSIVDPDSQKMKHKSRKLGKAVPIFFGHAQAHLNTGLDRFGFSLSCLRTSTSRTKVETDCGYLLYSSIPEP